MFDRQMMIEECWRAFFDRRFIALEESMLDLRKRHPEAYKETRDAMDTLIMEGAEHDD